MTPVKQASASLIYCFMKEKIGQIAKMRTNALLSERIIRIYIRGFGIIR